jgi:hypothetical protein
MGKVIEITLADNLRCQTIGAGEVRYMVDEGTVRGVGPAIDDVQVRWATIGSSAQFQWRVDGEYSNDGGETWDAMGSIMSDQTTDGQGNTSAYSTRTDFGTDVRFFIVVSNTSGGGVESGTLRRVTVAIRLAP